ncbi:hypothetical protein ACK280_15980 [Mycobacterium sherrisii]|uniref:hypothetical protein n=1 Tax=Mycobacterium sherrisii TaxID=243061 RepID=UPI003974C258
MGQGEKIDFINDPDLDIRDLSYSRSRVGQLLDLTKGSFFDMGFGPRDDDDIDASEVDADGDWPADRLEVYVKEKPRGPGYVCDIVYNSEQLPVTVYAVLVNRGRGLEVAELELFRRYWGYFDEYDNYSPPDSVELPDSQDPPALINSDVLRRVPLGDIIARTERQLADDSWRTEGVRSFLGPNLMLDELTDEQRRALENSSTSAVRRRGRPELSDELLIDVAETYVWEAGRGRGALRRMSEVFDRPEATIRDWIAIARRRGYLAPTKPGRRGAAPGPNLPTIRTDSETARAAGHVVPNLSRQRRRHMLRMIEGEGVLDADLPESARLTYVVGGLMCNDTGFLRQDDLQAGMANPEVLQAAVEILAKARQRAHKRHNGSGQTDSPARSRTRR